MSRKRACLLQHELEQDGIDNCREPEERGGRVYQPLAIKFGQENSDGPTMAEKGVETRKLVLTRQGYQLPAAILMVNGRPSNLAAVSTHTRFGDSLLLLKSNQRSQAAGARLLRRGIRLCGVPRQLQCGVLWLNELPAAQQSGDQLGSISVIGGNGISSSSSSSAQASDASATVHKQMAMATCQYLLIANCQCYHTTASV